MAKYGKPGKGGGRLTLTIEPPRNAAYKPFEDEFRRNDTFQKILDLMSSSVQLPRDVAVVAKECGQINAFWSPRTGQIILCYEMYGEIVQLFLAAAQAGQKSQGSAPPSTPQPRAGGPLVGVWNCQNNATGSTEQIALNSDGSFRSAARDYPGAVNSWGRWSVQGSTLTFQLVGYQPPQRSLPRQIDVTYSMPNANTIQVGALGTPPGFCQRMQ